MERVSCISNLHSLYQSTLRLTWSKLKKSDAKDTTPEEVPKQKGEMNSYEITNEGLEKAPQTPPSSSTPVPFKSEKVARPTSILKDKKSTVGTSTFNLPQNPSLMEGLPIDCGIMF